MGRSGCGKEIVFPGNDTWGKFLERTAARAHSCKDLDCKCQTERQHELKLPGNDRIKNSLKEKEAESPKIKPVDKILLETSYRKGLFRRIDNYMGNEFVF